jgi:hypothetical protein
LREAAEEVVPRPLEEEEEIEGSSASLELRVEYPEYPPGGCGTIGGKLICGEVD